MILNKNIVKSGEVLFKELMGEDVKILASKSKAVFFNKGKDKGGLKYLRLHCKLGDKVEILDLDFSQADVLHTKDGIVEEWYSRVNYTIDDFKGGEDDVLYNAIVDLLKDTGDVIELLGYKITNKDGYYDSMSEFDECEIDWAEYAKPFNINYRDTFKNCRLAWHLTEADGYGLDFDKLDELGAWDEFWYGVSDIYNENKGYIEKRADELGLVVGNYKLKHWWVMPKVRMNDTWDLVAQKMTLDDKVADEMIQNIVMTADCVFNTAFDWATNIDE